MSGQCTGWVLRYGPHPEHEDRHGVPYGARARGLRSTLVAVADAANRDGEHAHPGTEAVSEAALYSRRQTISLLAELVAEGWLQVEHEGGGRGMATVYRVVMQERGNGAASAPNEDDERVQSDDRKGAVVDPERVQSEPETVQSRLHPYGVATEQSNGREQRERAALVAAFDEFWQVYPRHDAKASARKAWPAAVRKAGSVQRIVTAAAAYRDDPNREPRYTAHAATWLNAERWGDPPLPSSTQLPRNVRTVDTDRSAPTGRIEL